MTIDPRRNTCLLPECWRPAGCPAQPGEFPENTITVSPSGGNYTSIEDALNAITAPGPNNRYCISVGPGVYTENNPLPGKQYTRISGCGQNTTRIEAANANQDLFTSANFFIIEDVSLADVSGTGWIMDITANHAVIFEDCVAFQCENGFRLNNAGAVLTLRDVIYLSILGVTMTCGARNNAGDLTVSGGRVGEGSTITTVFDFDGANAISTVQNFLSFESTVTTMVTADNDARSVFSTCSFVSMFDCAVLQGGSDTRFVATSVFLAGRDAIRIENVGADTNFVGQGITVESTTRYDLNILSATGTVSGFGQSSIDQMNFVSGAHFTASFVDLKEDDEGLNVVGELHVGSPELPSESVFGSGDSYTRGMLVYTYNPAGAVWTDVSTAARSASGSTFTFPAVAQNNAIYVASSLQDTDYLQHYGIKLSCTVAAVLGAGSIVVEYWNGASWVAIEHMSTMSSSPYTQYANDLFIRVQSEQLRYPRAFLSSWAKNDPGMGLGTNYYWIRYRIATAITTAPTFQQWKLHTNRSEMNADGMLEFFGAARPERELVSHLQIATAVIGSAPGNASVAFTATTTLSFTRNQFSNNSVDSFGQLITIPTGLDTSIPITVECVWYPDTNNAGDVELRAIPGQLAVGDLFDGSVADGATVADVNTVAANSRYQSRQTSFDLDIADLTPGDFLVVRIERDATVGNDPPDTLAGNIIHAEFRAFGTAWRA